MIIHKCDLCGKFLNEYDEQENFGLHYNSIGYGSKYDGCNINIDWNELSHTRDFSHE